MNNNNFKEKYKKLKEHMFNEALIKKVLKDIFEPKIGWDVMIRVKETNQIVFATLVKHGAISFNNDIVLKNGEFEILDIDSKF